MNELAQTSVQEEVILPSEEALVKQWLDKIRQAKVHWAKDFKRMKDDMAFNASVQWAGQTTMEDDRYIVNLIHRLISQKVASIYARNPTVEVTPTERMLYQIWDESLESLQSNVMQAQQMVDAGIPLPPELAAFFADVDNGKSRERLVKNVARTLQLLLTYQMGSQIVDFKDNMKAAVRRTEVASVSYCVVNFCRDDGQYKDMSSIDVGGTVADRMSRVQGLLREISEKSLDTSSPEFEELQVLMTSVSENPQDQAVLQERIEFDFPMATSIIIDPACRSLKNFVAAEWVAHEFVVPLECVNTVFKTDIKVGDIQATEANEQNPTLAATKEDQKAQTKVCFYRLWDYKTKTECWLVDGWKSFVQQPAAPLADVTGFWPIYALTFNDVEIEPDATNSIFPPSTVQLAKPAQKEWNRTRQALRMQRLANSPRYLVRKGMLTDEDKTKLAACTDNEVIEVAGCPPETNLQQWIVPFVPAPIDPALYDTAPLEKDLLLATGMQQANLGPAQPNVTATVGNIAENSRLDVVGSNIDDLDCFLSRIMQCAGEMSLQLMSRDTVVRIVGQGAVWPEQDEERADFLNEILIKVKAASSGRPNKTMDMQNWSQSAQILQAAGASPIFMVEETLRRLDDRMDIEKAFPLLPTTGNAPSPEGEEEQPTGASGPSINEENGPPAPNPQNDQLQSAS